MKINVVRSYAWYSRRQQEPPPFIGRSLFTAPITMMMYNTIIWYCSHRLSSKYMRLESHDIFLKRSYLITHDSFFLACSLYYILSYYTPPPLFSPWGTVPFRRNTCWYHYHTASTVYKRYYSKLVSPILPPLPNPYYARRLAPGQRCSNKNARIEQKPNR